MDKNEKLKELKLKLDDLKNRNPSHHNGITGYMGHSFSPELFSEIEDLEEEIKKLEAPDGGIK